jgi:dipicolinate synthase subunit A
MGDFLVLGGDTRSVYAAKELSLTHSCDIFGFDQGVDGSPRGKWKYVVLPLPASRDGVNVNAPHHGGVISLKNAAACAKPNGIIFAGKADDNLRAIAKANGTVLLDYFEREELTLMNALLTAEGALQIILRESKRSVFGMKVLVAGYGRIAKFLVKYLVALGANVTVAARQFKDIAASAAAGARTLRFAELRDSIGAFDCVVNTAPAEVFTSEICGNAHCELLAIDLASTPGFARNAPFFVITALSLPGTTAPVTAGKIIADTISNILEERAKI